MPAATPEPPHFQLTAPHRVTAKDNSRSDLDNRTSPPNSTGQPTPHQPPKIIPDLPRRSPQAQNSGRFVKVPSTAVLLFVAALTACGGSQLAPSPSPSCATASFDNRTNGGVTDAQLEALWQQAQQDLATQTIPLNPVTVLMQGAVPDLITPDSRALGVQPKCIAVIAVPDLTVAQLQAENPSTALQHNTNPTGVIHCPEGAQAKYCCAYTASNNEGVYVTASELQNFGATGWEFENIILARLGYNTSGR
jgi:hypothetical protein